MQLVNKSLVENCKCDPVDISDIDSIIETAKKMNEIMIKNNGVGLAAPQVGIFKRFFIMKNFQDNSYELIINPEIIWQSNKIAQSREGCLTYNNGPDRPTWVVKRPKSLNVRYCIALGEYEEKKISKLTAQIFHHEFEHLNGITIFNR